MMIEQDSTLQIVGPRDQFPIVTLVNPSKSGYLMLALEIDHRPPMGFFLQSQRKKLLLKLLKELAQKLRGESNVLDATVFKAMIVVPTARVAPRTRKVDKVNIARFDVVLLVEFTDIDLVHKFVATTQWTDILTTAEKIAHKTMKLIASNVRRIGPVDHSRSGVFLFNYFYADSLDLNLKVWNYTAGWFQDQTGLDNSTVLLPEKTSCFPYTIINHCRWDRLRDILPAIIFNKTFRPFVLANFEKNNTTAFPILYQLA